MSGSRLQMSDRIKNNDELSRNILHREPCTPLKIRVDFGNC